MLIRPSSFTLLVPSSSPAGLSVLLLLAAVVVLISTTYTRYVVKLQSCSSFHAYLNRDFSALDSYSSFFTLSKSLLATSSTCSSHSPLFDVVQRRITSTYSSVSPSSVWPFIRFALGTRSGTPRSPVGIPCLKLPISYFTPGPWYATRVVQTCIGLTDDFFSWTAHSCSVFRRFRPPTQAIQTRSCLKEEQGD